ACASRKQSYLVGLGNICHHDLSRERLIPAMDRFPAEFEEILTAAGRRVLAGRSPLCGALAEPRRRFLAEAGLVSERAARAAAQLLDRALYDRLELLEQPIPPESIWEMTRNYAELLPKTARVRT